MNFPINTDTNRIKSITQKDGNTYPFGSQGMYVDMLSGLDLQEQLLFGNGIHTTSVQVKQDNEAIFIIEIFSIKEEENTQELYKKETKIYKQKRQRSNIIINNSDDTSIASTFLAADWGEDESPDTSDDTLLIYDFIDTSGFGNVITTLYRKENNAWVAIHKKKTEVSISLSGQINEIKEYMIDINGEEDSSDVVLPENPDETTDNNNTIGTARINHAVVGANQQANFDEITDINSRIDTAAIDQATVG